MPNCLFDHPLGASLYQKLVKILAGYDLTISCGRDCVAVKLFAEMLHDILDQSLCNMTLTAVPRTIPSQQCCGINQKAQTITEFLHNTLCQTEFVKTFDGLYHREDSVIF